MKASEFINDLRTLIQERGDLEVVNDQGEDVMVSFSPADPDEGLEDAFVVE